MDLAPAALELGRDPSPHPDLARIWHPRLAGRARSARDTYQLRHYYASVMLAGGVSIKELAEYLGHSDPAFTLRVYAHMLPCSHDRARAVISERFTRVIGPDS